MTTTMWTLAYRKPKANRFQRVTNWEGTWHQAQALAGEFAKANPQLQVWYVPTLASEANGCAEDAGNVLVDSGKRIRIRETGQLSAELIGKVRDAAELKAEFDARAC